MTKRAITTADGGATAAAAPPRLSLVSRILNSFGAAVCLASALAVLGGNLADPGYRAQYRDAIWFVLAYAAFYAWVLYAFAWSGRLRVAQALAVVKAIGAYGYLAVFPAVGRSWMVWTPGRYVYQLFDWGTEAGIVLMAYVFILRGAWNTVNAFTLTRDLWFPLRRRRPLFGRIVTMIPVAITVLCVWAFLRLARMNAEEFSPEAHEIADIVANDIQCDEIRAKAGTTTTDVRQRGDRRYDVMIRWDCTDLRIIVRDPDGKAGTTRTPRPECCS
jgi:lysylphosphatidylglycerol synthetase-like protein (DUF2156 family)